VIQSNSRALFADFIPKGHEASFFSIYQLTDKMTSWIGPVVIGQISADNMTDKRYAFIYLLVMSIIPAVLLQFAVNLRQGMIAAGRYVED
jgi:UMF1 family MFS transporter